MCVHKRLFLVLDSDSCLRELHREPRTIFIKPHRNTGVSNYELGQLCVNFYCELRVFEEDLSV